MTDDDPGRDDERRADRGAARSAGPRTSPDGGASQDRLFAALPDPAIYYESEGGSPVARAVNPAFESVFDVEESTVADNRLVEHLLVETADREPTSRWVRQEAAGDTAWADDAGDPDAEANPEEILGRLTDGERVIVGFGSGAADRRYFRLASFPTSSDDTGGYVVYTDVTDLERRVCDLGARADRLERVVSITAHDLRNPLDVAKIRLEAARDTGDEVHFEKIEGALARIRRIVSNVRSIGAGGSNPSESVPLDAAAESAWSTVETTDATLSVGGHLPTVRANSDTLQQLLENLFRNAVEHGRRDATVTVGSLPDGFYVEDDGPGIPTADRERAFEPGYSTVDENTGLGLAIVRQIAEDHGWRVALDDDDARGTRVTFRGVETEGAP